MLAPLSIYGIFAVLLIPVTSGIGDVIGAPLTQAAVQLMVMALVPVAFVVAAGRGGFARTGEVDELGTLLGDGGRTELADLLRATLGDGTVELLFRVPGAAGWVNSAGVGAIPPTASGRRGVAPVELAGETIGAIVYDATLLTRPDEVRDAARVVALALDRERLAVELRVSRARLVEAGDAERRRISRDLHDGLQSRLVLLAVQAGVAEGTSPELRAGLEAAIDELRDLVHGVMPAELTERGLPAAVKGLADRMPIGVVLAVEGFEERPAPAVESTAFFVTAEAMVNAVKHARATELTVTLARDAERLGIDVRVPGLPVLVLSQYLQRDYAVELQESGDEGVGYLLKQRVADVDRFVADLHRVVAGGTVLDPEVVAAMVGRHRAEADPVALLTDRQREVLELMAQGRSNAAIAGELSVSEKAIVRHTSNIYAELGLGSSPDDHRRVLAVVRFLSA